MNISLLSMYEASELAVVSFVSMLLFSYIGNLLGKRFHTDSEREGAVLGSLFALLGLLLAFTFSMSVSRYDKRLEIIVQESNDIGTAVLRCDLYPEEDRKLLRAVFKEYVEARIAFFNCGTDVQKIIASQKESCDVSKQIWDHVARLSKIPTNQVASMQMIPALNDMIDITSTRWFANIAKVPDMVLFLLYALACACAFYAGYSYTGLKRMDLINVVGFCLLTSIVVWVIIDMDRPRSGFVTLKETHEAMIGLREMFK